MEEVQLNIIQYLNQKCPLCLLPFDDTIQTPMMLCHNQHLSCKNCYEANLKIKAKATCPSCRATIDHKKVTKFRMLINVIQGTNQNKTLLRFNQLQFLRTRTQNKEQHLSHLELEEMFQMEKILMKNQISNLEDILMAQALTHFKEESISKCIALCKIIIENNPKQQDEYLGLGSKEEMKGYYEGRVVKWFIEKFEGRKVCCYDILGLCFLIVDKFEQQQQWYAKMNEIYPQDYKILFGLAVTYHNHADLKKAEELYVKIGKMNPEFAKPYQMRGFISLSLKKLKWNHNIVEQSLRLNKSSIHTRYLMARFKHQNRQYESCRQMIAQITKIEPKYGRAIELQGLKLFEEKKYSLAVEIFQKCVQINPEYYEPILYQGKCYRLLEKYQRSLQALRLYENYNKNDDECLYLLGRVSNLLFKYELAQKYLLRCKQLNPSHCYVYYELSNNYKNRDLFQKAVQMYQQDLKYSPDTAKTFQLIIECFEKLNDYSKVVEWTYKLIKISPKDELHLKIAKNYFENKDYCNALNKYRECRKLNLPQSQIYESIIEIYAIQNDYENLFEQSKNLAQGSKASQNVLQKLAIILENQAKGKKGINS